MDVMTHRRTGRLLRSFTLGWALVWIGAWPLKAADAEPFIGLRQEAESAPAPEMSVGAPTVETFSAPVVGVAVDLNGPAAPELAASELAAPPGLSAPPAPPPATVPAGSSAPSQNVTVNLINRLVQRGALSKEDAADLIKQAEMDAATARAQAASAQFAAAGSSPSADDSVRVTYVPEVVKAQMREDIKQSVMQQARAENWAAPRSYPDWISRFHLMGDVRARYEGDFFPAGNDTANGQLNFNSINTSGSGLNMLAQDGSWASPNVDQDRERIRLRARFGVDVDLNENFTSGFRMATGENNSPVSENQSLGYANSQQGGNFSKYALWLDRAFIKYDVGGKPEKDLSVTVGRFDNPFFSTSMIWADDLAFDGLAVKGKYQAADGVTPFFTAGAFPVFNTDLNFSTDRETKYKSEDKWLYAVQAGTDIAISKELNLKVAAAYYHFQDIEGKVSEPFTPVSTTDNASTDDSRPAFAQRGNSYIALRDYDPTYLSGTMPAGNYQYFGLATPFRVAALTTRLDYSHFDPFHLWLVGEVVKNVAFDKGDIVNAGATANGVLPLGPGPVNNLDSSNRFNGGDMGAILTLNFGHAALEKRWDWNVNIGYRYVESDSVVDGFCDSDFGGGGTNLKGYTIGGNLALAQRVWAGLRWFSAESIAGPLYKADVVQLDINAKF